MWVTSLTSTSTAINIDALVTLTPLGLSINYALLDCFGVGDLEALKCVFGLLDVGVGNMLQDGFIPSFIEWCLVHKVQEVLGSDQVHDREESLAVMGKLEKVILGHQSYLVTNSFYGIRSVAELVFHRTYRFFRASHR